MNKFIPAGELFKDLQETLTDLFLIEVAESIDGDEFGEFAVKFSERRGGSEMILYKIEKIIKERYGLSEITHFLERGYPRSVDLGSIIGGEDVEQ